MSKVNGNDGNNNDLMKGLQAYYEALRAKASGKANKPAEVKPNVNVPIGQQNGIQHTDAMGGKLLESANFYAEMGLELNINKTQKPELGSLEDLQQKQDTVPSGNISQEDVFASLELSNLVKGNEYDKLLVDLNTLDTYRGYSEKYGKLQTPDKESGIKPTAEITLNIIDNIDSIVSFA